MRRFPDQAPGRRCTRPGRQRPRSGGWSPRDNGLGQTEASLPYLHRWMSCGQSGKASFDLRGFPPRPVKLGWCRRRLDIGAGMCAGASLAFRHDPSMVPDARPGQCGRHRHVCLYGGGRRRTTAVAITTTGVGGTFRPARTTTETRLDALAAGPCPYPRRLRRRHDFAPSPWPCTRRDRPDRIVPRTVRCRRLLQHRC